MGRHDDGAVLARGEIRVVSKNSNTNSCIGTVPAALLLLFSSLPDSAVMHCAAMGLPTVVVPIECAVDLGAGLIVEDALASVVRMSNG